MIVAHWHATRFAGNSVIILLIFIAFIHEVTTPKSTCFSVNSGPKMTIFLHTAHYIPDKATSTM